MYVYLRMANGLDQGDWSGKELVSTIELGFEPMSFSLLESFFPSFPRPFRERVSMTLRAASASFTGYVWTISAVYANESLNENCGFLTQRDFHHFTIRHII